MKPEIRTELLSPEHAALLFTPLSDPALYQYIPGSAPVSPEALLREFRRLSAGGRDPSQTWLNWVSWHDETPVGTLQATVLADKTALIAYVVLRSFWGQGFASQGCRWLLRELFEQRGVLEAFAHVDQRNSASLHVLAAVGLSVRTPKDPSDVDPGDVLLGVSAQEWRAHPR